MDRRSARRFELNVPVICKWVNHQDTQREMAGFSRNISAAGIFLITDVSGPAQGIAVEIEVFLPPINPESQGLELKSHGQVVRVTVVGGRSGVGIASSFHLTEQPEDPELIVRVVS